jgi:hypothetical protein
LGEVAGHVAGGLKSALVKAGLRESDAERWRLQIESGKAILLGAHVRAGDTGSAEAAMLRHSTGRVVRTEWNGD